MNYRHIRFLAGFESEAIAKGDLSMRCKKLPERVLGTDNAGYAVSHKEYKIETGKCDSLGLKSSGRKENVLRSANSFAIAIPGLGGTCDTG